MKEKKEERKKTNKKRIKWIEDVKEQEIEVAGLTAKQAYVAKLFWLMKMSSSEIAKETNVKQPSIITPLKVAQEKIIKIRKGESGTNAKPPVNTPAAKTTSKNPKIRTSKKQSPSPASSSTAAAETKNLKIALNFFRKTAKILKKAFAEIGALAKQKEKSIKDNCVAEEADEIDASQPQEITKPPPRKKLEKIAKPETPPKPEVEILIASDEAEVEIFQPEESGEEDSDLADAGEDIEPPDNELKELEKENIDKAALSLLPDEKTAAEEKYFSKKDILLNLYLKEAKKYPLLSREEELAAANEIGRARLIKHNLFLVFYLAKNFQGRGLDLLDLIQEGNIGLLIAAKKFKPELGFKFSTYAFWWIRQAVARALSDQSRTIRIPVHMLEKLNKLNRTEKYIETLGREPNDNEIADNIKLEPEKIKWLKEVQSQKTVSLSAPMNTHSHKSEEGDELEALMDDQKNKSPEEKTVEKDFIKIWTLVGKILHCDGNGRIFKIISRRDRGESLEEILKNLGIEQLTMPEKRFYIVARRGDEHTLQETASEFGISRERVRQIEAYALGRLRHPKWTEEFKKFL
ncbi:sigma-70 family RNA polymerase sigma factor [Candidatus Falkowbacteria bacterium]|nr:sigma-70 family RNA polymerase sigma factor [Candidatus Falkowbacteria bacterium]